MRWKKDSKLRNNRTIWLLPFSPVAVKPNLSLGANRKAMLKHRVFYKPSWRHYIHTDGGNDGDGVKKSPSEWPLLSRFLRVVVTVPTVFFDRQRHLHASHNITETSTGQTYRDTLYPVYTIKQTLSKHQANVFKIHAHDVCSNCLMFAWWLLRVGYALCMLHICSMFAWCLLDRVNGV